MFGDSLVVTTVGTASYNGVTFDAATHSNIVVKPVYDQAGRTVTHSIFTVTLEGEVYAEGASGTDTIMDTNRRLLQQPGGAFDFTGQGFGTMSVNSGSAKDVKWGPKPTLVSWEPIGGKYAARVIWQCEIAMPNMCANPLYEKGILALNYRLVIAHDRSGNCRRTFSGYLEIPMTRASVNDVTLPDHVDNYRHLVVIDLPDGFRRESEHFAFDESKCRLDFTIVDEQDDGVPLPPGIISADVEHSVQSSPRNFTQWQNVISGTYEMARNVDRQLAFQHFHQLTLIRLERAQKRASVSVKGKRTKGVVILTNLNMREKVYGKTANFSAAFSVTTSLGNILDAVGLWTPVPGKYGLWKASLVNSILHPEGRGSDGFILEPDSDRIIDLCHDQDEVGVDFNAINNTGRNNRKVFKFAVPKPSPEASWLYYVCDQVIEEQDQHVLLKPLPISPALIGAIGGGVSGVAVQLAKGGFKALFQKDSQPPQVQSRAAPTYYVTLVGRALRAGYTIPQPRLVSFGGNDVVLSNRPNVNFFKTGVVANYGIPIVAAKWSLRYLVKGTPAKGIWVEGGPELERDTDCSSDGGDFGPPQKNGPWYRRG